MTLRKKTALIVGATLVSLLVFMYFASRIILLNSFARLEEEIAQKNVQRVLDSLSTNLSALNDKAGDWASSDEIHAFIRNGNGNSEFIKRNFTDNTFSELKLNVALFMDSSGKLVFGKAFDLHNRKGMSVPQSVKGHILPGSLLLRHSGITSSLTGIIDLPEGPMLVASHPILTSQGKGPVSGTLVFGRYLDREEIRRLAEATNYSLAFERLDNPGLPRDFQAVRPYLSAAAPLVIRPLSSQTISGYALLNDVYGKPVLMARVDMDRDIYRQGQDSLFYFILSLVVIGLVLGSVTIILLEEQVIARLTRLIKNVGFVGASGNSSMRIQVRGEDELSRLSDEINRMLEALERSGAELRDSEEKYRTLVEDINIGVYRATGEYAGRFLHANPAMIKMFGYDSIEEFMGIAVSDLYENPKERELFIEKIRGQGFVKGEELKLRRKDGISMWGSVTAKAHYRADGAVEWIDGVIEDITERKRMEEALRTLSLRDELTGLYNRRGFLTLAEQQLKVANRVRKGMLLIFADLDGMKEINDSLGHQEGDRALIDVGYILKKTFRESDIIARFGGDEFVVLSLETPESSADVLAHRLTEHMNYHNRYENRPYTLSVSTGIARYDPENPMSLHDLLINADRMMYENKKEKKR